jgi:hypothetical protein
MVRALSGIDDNVIALFLKDQLTVFEIERDEPPPATQLIYSPDNALAVEIDGVGDAATITALILDSLFKYDGGLGYGVLRRVRYMTRTELEETAYQNKVRRLDVHGFVDYFEALSIYAGVPGAEIGSRRPDGGDEPVQDEERKTALPTVFADSLSEVGFLAAALEHVPAERADRVGEELTALGNRILSANLVNLGEVEGIRVALGEMRDFLTIGLEHLSGRDPARASQLFVTHHVQQVFMAGFDLLVNLRSEAERLARFPGFRPELLESPDQEFVAGLIRFKPIVWDDGRYRNFRDLAEVEAARDRIADIRIVSETLIEVFGSAIGSTLRQAFNTALVQQAANGRFSPSPVAAADLERVLAGGVDLPRPDLPEPLQRICGAWFESLKADLAPLVGKPIDPRFVGVITMEM